MNGEASMPDDMLSLVLLGQADPPPAFCPTEWMFTTETIAGARTFLAGLDGPGEVLEYRGRYFPLRAGSEDAAWLRSAGATLIPPEDDPLHHHLDRFLRELAEEASG
jgi:hypothetical protein